MAKAYSGFNCSVCGSFYSRWQGKCSSCGNWNTLEAQIARAGSGAVSKRVAKKLHEVDIQHAEIVETGIEELDLVLGGGLVPGASILFGGEPGIGKSTLSLQWAIGVASQNHVVLYVTGEEADDQILLRAQRLGYLETSLYVLQETNVQLIVQAINDLKPKFVVLDSIQVVYHPDISAVSGSVTQVRECTALLNQHIKELRIAMVIIGHITKDGALAGPKTLEHMVDVIMVMEGERDEKLRTLRCYKNRYSHTDEIGLFEIRKDGLWAADPECALDRDTLKQPGSILSVLCNGNRGIVIEIQSLVVETGYGVGKRTFLGVDSNRAFLMIAAIEKILRIKLYNKDIILSIVNGLKSADPALDLAIIMAILSSLFDSKSLEVIGILGEVGLTGEIRPVLNTDKRLAELYKMGFKTCMIPEKSVINSSFQDDFGLIRVQTIQEAVHKMGVLKPCI